MFLKADVVLSFDEVVLLKLGLNELRRSYSSCAEKLAEEGFSDDAFVFKERVAEINRLDNLLRIY